MNEIKPHKKNKDLFELSTISTYLSINFGFIDMNDIYSDQDKNYLSFVSIFSKPTS